MHSKADRRKRTGWRAANPVAGTFLAIAHQLLIAVQTLYGSASQPVGRDPLVGREAISGGSRSISKC